MTRRHLLRIFAATLMTAAFVLQPVYAAPERNERAHFDTLAVRFDARAKNDPAALRRDFLSIDRSALDDERWIDLHVGLMKLAANAEPPSRGLPDGVSAPAATSGDVFDQRCERKRLRPIGEAAYAHTLRTTHGLDMTAMHVLRIGRRARADMRDELAAFAEEHGNGETWHEMAVRERAARPTSDEDLAQRYDAFTAEATRFVIEKGLVTVPDEARGLVVHLRGRFGYPFAIYEPGNGWKAGKLGRVVMGKMPRRFGPAQREEWFGDFNDHFQRIVAIHEGVPGHHLQFTRAAAAYKGMRRRAYNSVYVEGWGLYTEGLLARHGYITDPLDQFAALRMRAWRAVRCYVDPALHAGLIRPSQAVQLLIDEAGLSRRAAEMEVQRYLRDPTQPIGYWIGRQRIEAIRAAYLALHGDDAEREFHDRFLASGAIPLPLAEAVLLGRRASYDAAHSGD